MKKFLRYFIGALAILFIAAWSIFSWRELSFPYRFVQPTKSLGPWHGVYIAAAGGRWENMQLHCRQRGWWIDPPQLFVTLDPARPIYFTNFNIYAAGNDYGLDGYPMEKATSAGFCASRWWRPWIGKMFGQVPG